MITALAHRNLQHRRLVVDSSNAIQAPLRLSEPRHRKKDMREHAKRVRRAVTFNDGYHFTFLHRESRMVVREIES